MDLIRKGKVKDVYDDGDKLVFKFSNRISVFDKIIPNEIPLKGESLCRTSTYWYKIVKDIGIETDFIQLKDKNEMIVKKYSIFHKGREYYSNYMIPLEFIARYYVAGTFYDRIKSGTIDYHDVGFKNMPEYGQEFPDPYFEMTTKFEKFDRSLNFGEAQKISGLEKSEIYEIMENIFKIDRRINSSVNKRGLIHVDGKKEFALGIHRIPVIIDTFGTLDEDRFWDKKEYENGKINELSKEMVRQYYRDIGYHDKLYSAREKNEKEPDIPPLPNELVNKISSMYRDMYEKITGLKW